MEGGGWRGEQEDRGGRKRMIMESRMELEGGRVRKMEEEGGGGEIRRGRKRRTEEKGRMRMKEKERGRPRRKEDGELIQFPPPFYLFHQCYHPRLLFVSLSHLLVSIHYQRLLQLALTETNTTLMNGRKIGLLCIYDNLTRPSPVLSQRDFASVTSPTFAMHISLIISPRVFSLG